MKPFISLVMINLNNGGVLKSSVFSILSQIENHPLEFIVVDSGSTDDSLKILKQLKSGGYKFKIIYPRGSKVFWINNAREIGLLYSRGMYIGFLDSDCIYPSQWLTTVIDNIKQYPKVAAIFGPRFPDEGRGLGTLVRRVEGYQSRKYIDKQKRIFHFSSPKIYYFVGSNLVVKKSVVMNLGLYDPLFYKSSFEDVDLQERILKSEGEILFDPELIIRHIHPLSLIGLIKKSFNSGAGFALLSVKHPNVLVGKWSPFYDLIYVILFLLGFFGLWSKSLFLFWGLFILFTFYRMYYRNFKKELLIYLPLLPFKSLRDMTRLVGSLFTYLKYGLTNCSERTSKNLSKVNSDFEVVN